MVLWREAAPPERYLAGPSSQPIDDKTSQRAINHLSGIVACASHRPAIAACKCVSPKRRCLPPGCDPDMAAAAHGMGDLATLGMPELAALPTSLHADEMVLQEQSRSLALASFQVHIDCVDASGNITAELAELAATGTRGRDSASQAAALLAGDVGSRLEELLGEHLRVQRAIHHERELLDVAELPAVAEACLRNGRYSQLLDLSALADGLAVRHPVGTPRHAVAAAIAVAVDDCRSRALFRIEESLSVPRLPLTTALDLVQPLRRLLKQQGMPGPGHPRPTPRPRASPRALSHLAGLEADAVIAELFDEGLSRAIKAGPPNPRARDPSGSKPSESWDAITLVALLRCRSTALHALLESSSQLAPLQRLRRSMDACRGAWIETPQVVQAAATAFTGAGVAGTTMLDGHVTEALADWVSTTSARAVAVVQQCCDTISTGSDLALAADAVAFAMEKAAIHCADRLPEAQAVLRACAVRLLATKLQSGVREFASEVQRGAWAFLSAIRATGRDIEEDESAGGDEAASDVAAVAQSSDATTTPRAPSALLGVPPLARAANVFIRAMDEARRCRHVVGPTELPRLAAAFVRALAEAQDRAVSQDVIGEMQTSDGHTDEDADAARMQQARLSEVLIVEFVPFTERVVQHLLK